MRSCEKHRLTTCRLWQERLKQERWEAEQNKANKPEPEPEPEPPKPARQAVPEPEPEPTYDDSYQTEDNPYEDTENVYNEAEASQEQQAPPSAETYEPEESPYELGDDDTVYNQPEDAGDAGQKGLTALALYDYQAGEFAAFMQVRAISVHYVSVFLKCICY